MHFFQVDIFQVYIVELYQRENRPLFHFEHFIEGKYVKYNSNSGYVLADLNFRMTPQVFISVIMFVIIAITAFTHSPFQLSLWQPIKVARDYFSLIARPTKWCFVLISLKIVSLKIKLQWRIQPKI